MLSSGGPFVDTLQTYSNLWGKAWWLLNICFRGFVIHVIGENIFTDDDFSCDSNQPGCTKTCRNRFVPINSINYWSMQIVFLFIPTIFFYAYATRFTARANTLEDLENEIKELELIQELEMQKRERELEENGYIDDANTSVLLQSNPGTLSTTGTQEALQASTTKLRALRRKVGKYKRLQKINYMEGAKREAVDSSKIKSIYIVHCLFKICIEIFFLWGNYALQLQQSQEYDSGVTLWSKAWTVPEKYVCQTSEKYSALIKSDNFYGNLFFTDNHACNQNSFGITCWVGKPNEKTFFLKYMILMDYVCILVCILEAVVAVFALGSGCRKSKMACRKPEDISWTDSVSQVGGKGQKKPPLPAKPSGNDDYLRPDRTVTEMTYIGAGAASVGGFQSLKTGVCGSQL